MATTLDQDLAAAPAKTHSLEDMREAREKDVRDAIRSTCRSKLEACAHDSSSAMSSKDVEDYIRMGMMEDKLTYAKSESEKTKALREMRDQFVPQFISQTKEAGRKAMALIGKARAEKAISLENVEQWKNRMKNSKWDWKTRKSFIENELPNYVHNWKMVAAKRRKIMKDPRMAALKQSDLVSKADLAQFLSGSAFLNAEYPRRKELSATIESALGKLGKAQPMEKLKRAARQKLEAAASRGGLAKSKIDGWMQRIFKRSWSPEKITSFLTGSAWNDLPKLSERWIQARQRFDIFDKKRQEDGTPRNFHFVKVDVFLGWDFDKRESYLEKAERSFSLMEIAEKGDRTELNSLKMDIGHAMHQKDWEYAGMLLKDAFAIKADDPLLKSMQATLTKHAEKPSKGPKEGLDVRLQKAEEESRAIINEQFPDSEKKHIAEACEHPDVKCMERVAQVWYNRVWCHKHGFLNVERESEQRSDENNKEKTRTYMEAGHSKYYEANIIGGDTAEKEAIRDECRKPQVLHVRHDGKQAAYEKIKENRNNAWFGYWSTYVPEGLEYDRHKYIVENQMWKLKRNKRLLAANGREFRMHHASPAAHKPKTASGAHHALAA